MSLQAQFDEFRQKIEPTPKQIEQVIGSHTHLRENVLQKLDYVSYSILTGSYKRKTLIRPLNDVDVFAILSYSSPYHQDTPSPKTILQKLKEDLGKAYPTSEPPVQDRPCVVLDFTHCKFEVTPSIELYNKYYIPDITDLSKWLETEAPDVLGGQLTTANKANNDMLIPLIKMMKRCKQKHSNIKMKSFEMEKIAIQTFSIQYLSATPISSYRNGVERLLEAYAWYGYTDMQTIKSYTDNQFAKFCRETLFGTDFPN